MTTHSTATDLPVVTWPVFADYPVDAVVTTRDGGVSTGRYASLNLCLGVGDEDALVLENRRRVAAAIGVDLDDFVFCEQTHGRTVMVAGAKQRGRGTRDRDSAIQSTDALVTTTPGVVLVMMVADCVPLVLFEPRARVLACVHAGWAGTVRGVTTEAIATMTELGADPARILAGIGPAISPESYQVGQEVAEAARAAFGGPGSGDSGGDSGGDSSDSGGVIDGIIRPDGTGRWLFNLWAANQRQLRDAGVPEQNIDIADLPTGPGTPFFSHRAEQPCGRFAAVARLRDAEAATS